jgi:hypothetical protein
MDGSNVGQIWASVNDGPAHQVTHQPSSSADCRRNEHWSPPAFSPDLSKILSAWGSADCTDGPETGQLYIVDAGTGATTAVPSALGVRLSLRQAGWIDNTHIWWMDPTHVYQYTLGGGSSTSIGTIGSFGGGSYTGGVEGALRGATLFFSQATGTLVPHTAAFSLKRFDMTSHTVLGGSVDLGTPHPCGCSLGDLSAPGFDASADGSHIVYQRVAPNSNGDGDGVASSQFFYANADGSGASQIASYATSTTFARIQIAPNGRLVAIARAEPAPGDVITASVTSPGHNGDPDLHFYGPSCRSYPVWKWDTSAFWASTLDLESVYPPTTGNLEHFALGVDPGSVSAAGGSNPWYTIGS